MRDKVVTINVHHVCFESAKTRVYLLGGEESDGETPATRDHLRPQIDGA